MKLVNNMLIQVNRVAVAEALVLGVTHQLYQMARAAGLNKEDGLAVIKVLERLAGVEVAAAG